MLQRYRPKRGSTPGVLPPSRISLFSLILLCPFPVPAQQAVEGGFNQSTMTGDWGRARTTLQDKGINIRAHFTTESAGNPLGGNYQTGRYTQQIDFGADFDLNRLMRMPDAKIQVTLTDRVGRSLSADALGNQFAVQELYGAGQNFRLAEMNYQQDLLKQKVTIQLGWSPIGDNFAGLPGFCNFQNGVICGHANAMTVNSGAHNFPTAEWGARIQVRPRPDFYVATGIYQVNPNQGDADAGFNLSFRSTGAFVPIELGWSPGRGSGELPGDYKIGGYYNSSKTPDVLKDVNGFSAALTGEPFEQHGGRWGGYIMADHMVFREQSSAMRGLTLGFMAAMGDPDTAKYRYFWVAGGHYQGTFARRDNDVVSFMVAYARTNSRLTRYQQDLDTVVPGAVGIQTYESIAEIDYGVQLTPWLKIRPNLQYVFNPGGTGKIRNAFVMGLYMQLTL
ncbi:MAG: carbohydrate-selective porin [Bryobacterales bacterium]|nr:carbohydrate-selective porin [Bryobacterales bacterium]